MDTTSPLTSTLPVSDRGVRRFGYAVLFLGLGGFATWSALAPLESAALAPGVVSVEGYRKTVQHLEGGIVRAVHVRDGDRVASGQVLVELDDTRARADLEVVRAQYLALRAQEARLLAERDGLPEPAFPPELLTDPDPDLAAARSGQQRLFQERRRSLQGEQAILAQRIEQLTEQIRGLEAVQAAKQAVIESYKSEIKDLRGLFERGMGDKVRLRELERAVATLEAERAEGLAETAAARAQVSETRLRVHQLEQRWRTELIAELRETQDRLAGLRERMRALEDTLARTRISAPTAGTVVGLALHTLGGVLPAGGRVLDLVPAEAALLVEAQLAPRDVARVQPGQSAQVRFTAFQHRTTPVLQGTVQTVSADSLLDSATRQSYYLVRVQVTSDVARALEGKALQPGMPAEVMVRTGAGTPGEYLVKPLLDGFARAFREE